MFTGLENLFLALYPPLTYTGIPQGKVDWSQIYIPNITWQDWDKIRKELAQPKNELVYTVSSKCFFLISSFKRNIILLYSRCDRYRIVL